MKTIFFFIILIGGLFLSSCSEKKTALKDEVMAIHDSIMPRMSELMDLQETLTLELTQTDSLLAAHPADSALISRQSQLQRLIANLKGADQAMMHWMHEYNADTLTKLEAKQADLYLQNQKKAIETVRDQMQKSITDAQTFRP
ncbi:viral A-type inclusion protein [Siphonobacter sp. SORGH_AS_1065]|uniref:viral A-type inclusion protein n=1 Tax=Siphonobacter sp. SORGH_AS_1065 TaxID=3041795 RepID=UPI00278ACFC0|nr:viral A-type inclusion protein [Siphonobacter sp. SORGH_AS_1065]MDQ1090417.1 hypothetical protein [Siphonobacter sp. SORGH_AS_1065]